MTMGIAQGKPPPQDPWSEGQSTTPIQKQEGDTTVFYGNNGNATGSGAQVQGVDLAGNQISSSTPSVNAGLYGQGINLAQHQAGAYGATGNADLGRSGPQISNANAGASRAELGQVNAGYGSLENGLASTAAGGGINAGQAVTTQGNDAAIAAAMRGAGGGPTATGLGGASAAMGASGMAGAQTRAQQIQQAQSGLANAYENQGGMNLSTYGNEQANALKQSELNEQNNAQNLSQDLQMQNLAQTEQGAAEGELQNYNHQGIATINAATNQQGVQNNQTVADLGFGLGIAGSAAKIAGV